MLTIRVPGPEAFDNAKEEFTTVGETVLELEHSLVSLSKWESEFEISFLETKEKTQDQVIGYIKAMTLTPDVPEEVFYRLSEENFQAINAYLNAKMTATFFFEEPGPPKKQEIITAELVYYWMTAYHIPFECENWHLNRLLTLIRVCNVKQGKPKKMSRSQIAERNRQLNAQRKAKLGTKG